MAKLSEQLNIRIPDEMLTDLETIAEYEHSKVPELVRSWVRDKISEYRKDKRFREWLEKKRKE